MPQRSGTFFVKGEKIVLKKDGTWVADDIEITHEQTRDLFSKVISWDAAEKKYCLTIGYETIFITVEDTPYFVTSLERGAQPMAKLSNSTSELIRAEQLSYENDNLYLTLADGQRAKFLSAPYYDLLVDLKEDNAHYYLTIGGARVNLSTKDHESPACRPASPKQS